MQKIISENLMIMNPSGSNVSNINGDVTINVVRYNLRIKFSGDKGFSDIWLYINIPQNTIYFTTYVINKPIGLPLKKEKIIELLTCLLYEPKTVKTVFEQNLLKPFRDSPKFLSYKWKANNYKILIFNLKNMFKAKSGIILNLYNKENNNQQNQDQQSQQNQEPNKLEITDEILKQNIEKEFKQTVSPDAFNKLKNITEKLSGEVKTTGSPLKQIDKESIKEDLKNLFTKFFDKKKEFLIVLKNLKIIDQAFDVENEENIAQISEQKKSFYKELKNIDLFLENYLGK